MWDVVSLFDALGGVVHIRWFMVMGEHLNGCFDGFVAKCIAGTREEGT
jgi:hypothetical protein